MEYQLEHEEERKLRLNTYHHTELDQIKEYFQKHGYVVITDVITANDIENTVDEVKKLNIPFGFKANLWKNEEPIPASEILKRMNNDDINNSFNPNKILGKRDDYTDIKFFEFSKRILDKGATILGGCCETKPSHIEKISVLKN